MNPNFIIDKYYPSEDDLRRILLVHSRQVADRSLAIVDAHPELHLDRRFVEEAAMLHDIGIRWCSAPGICCHGTEPYICHGMIGADLLRREGLPRHALVCERHTGTGISREQIDKQHLPLPPDRTYEPQTMEEQLICYADKFFSKSHLDRVLTVEQTAASLSRFGEAGVERFLGWARLFAL